MSTFAVSNAERWQR